MSMTLTPAVQYVTVCEMDELPIGLGRAFQVAGHSIALFRTRSGKVFALANRCPHKGGPLVDGMLAGERVVCPLHSFQFDSETGACDQLNVSSVDVYPVVVADRFVKVGVPVHG